MRIDLGLAIDSPDGLFVPVLRDVARSGRDVWRLQIDAAKQGVAERSLKPAELRDPTITLSNFGTIGGRVCGTCDHAAASGNRRGRPYSRRGRARRRRHRHASHAAAVAHLRSSRCDWRRSGAFSSRLHRRSRKTALTGEIAMEDLFGFADPYRSRQDHSYPSSFAELEGNRRHRQHGLWSGGRRRAHGDAMSRSRSAFVSRAR